MNLYKYVSDAINTKLGTTVNLEVPRNRDFGDFSTNAAMVMARNAARVLAQAIDMMGMRIPAEM